VITVLKGDKLVTACIFQSPILIHDSKRDLDTSRAIVGIKDARQSFRRKKIDNRFGQFDRGRIGESRK